MDEYVILRQIGEGSFGVVLLVKKRSKLINNFTQEAHTYKRSATSAAEQEFCVIKRIDLKNLTVEEQYYARKEIALLARVRHTYVVSYHKSFENGRQLCIVMEYCAGGDLHQAIQKRLLHGKFFPEAQIIHWFSQMAAGLQYLHRNRILHRDLKAQNVFLKGDGRTIKLGDFGVATVLENTYDMARTCIGTPYYLSPEICENRPYDTKTDVWSAGCVLYELAALRHPFQANNMKDLMMKIMRVAYPALPGHYSSNLKSLICEMLRKRPELRATMKEITEKPYIRVHLNPSVPSKCLQFQNQRNGSRKSLQLQSRCKPTKLSGRRQGEDLIVVTNTSQEQQLGQRNNDDRNCNLALDQQKQLPSRTFVVVAASSVVSRGNPPTSTVAQENGAQKGDCAAEYFINSTDAKTSLTEALDAINFDTDSEEITSRRELPPTPKSGRVVEEEKATCQQVNEGSLFAKAELLRAELEKELGLDVFRMLYEKLIHGGDWLSNDTIQMFEKKPTLCRQFHYLLLAECAYELQT